MPRWYSIFELEMAVKKGFYNFFNASRGKPLIWDAKSRRYVSHIEPNHSVDRENPYGSEQDSQALAAWRQRQR